MSSSQGGTARAVHPGGISRPSWFAVVLTVVGALVLVAVGLPTPAEAAFPGRNGRIAYELVVPTDTGFRVDIRSMKADGSDVQVLARDAWSPAWRADGKKLAFAREVDGKPQLFVMNPDGSRKKQITNLRHGADEPAWSPDGKRLAFVRLAADGRTSIWHLNAATGDDLKRVVAATDSHGRELYPEEPSWSPNGTRIAYSAYAYTNETPGGYDSAVFTVKPDGTGRKRLTPAVGFYGPDWAPDGSQILYFGGGSSSVCVWAIHVMKPDGSDKRAVVDTPCMDAWPAWSPNGKWIVFASDGPRFPDRIVSGLYLVRPDGRDLKLARRGEIWTSSWQPRL